MRRALLVVLLALPGLAALSGCGPADGEPMTDAGPLAEQALATAHTTRLPGSDPVTQALTLTQTVYAATREENAAGAIILAPQDAALAFTAMQRITHMPVNAPLLYLAEDGTLPEVVKREMERVDPDGVMQDGKVQVYVVGEVDPAVAATVRGDLGFKVREFRTSDPIELSAQLDRWQAALKSDHPDEVVISALDHPDGIAHGLGPMGWNAHMGKGFAWVYRDRVPEQTRELLSRRLRSAYIYLTGGPEVISDAVARELGRYGLVRRIAGPSVPATSAVNAGYKDFGRNWGWWWGWVPRDFGWGIAQAGHNYIVVAEDDVLGAIPAVLLGHMGKHGPLLVVRQEEVPGEVAEYLEMVRPFPAGPTKTILNHAWIIGDTSRISEAVQFDVDRLLRPSGRDPEKLPALIARSAGIAGETER